MRNRALLLTIARAAAALTVAWTVGACTHPSAMLMVDSPKLTPYQAPDIDEITGIDSEETPDAATAPAAGSAQAPHK